MIEKISEELTMTLPELPNHAEYEAYDTGDECALLRYTDVTPEECTQYEELLLAEGYRLHNAHEVLKKENRYAQYTDGEKSVTVFYTEAENVLLVAQEPLTMTALVPTEAAPFETVEGYRPRFWQIGLSDPPATGDKNYSGMCYLYLLADGSFLIYDGGHDDTVEKNRLHREQNARRIYETMKANAPDPEHMTVAAWVITHRHSDHIGALVGFCKLGFDQKVKIESVIINVPTYGQFADLSNAELYRANLPKHHALMDEFRAKGTTVYKAHPGQIFYLRNATVQMLFTHDMRTHEPLGNYNSASIVSRVIIEHEGKPVLRVMMTGDMYGVVAAKLVKVYGDTMDSDMVQIPHHGWFKYSDDSFYLATLPDYVLWPCAREIDENVLIHGHAKVWSLEWNNWVREVLAEGNMYSDKVFWGFFDTVEFELPFNGKNFKRTENVYYPEEE